MTSENGLQMIAIHIFPNISRSKGNRVMKFGQLIEYNVKYIHHAENSASRRLVPGLFLLFKSFICGESTWSTT